MSTVNTGSIAKLMWPGLNSIWGANYKEYQKEFDDIYETRQATKNYEELQQLVTMSMAPVKPEGSPIAYDDIRQGFTTRAKMITYALGIVITEEAIEDDQYMQMGKTKTSALAKSLRLTEETVAANIFNRANNTSYTGGDGSTLLASAAGGSATHGAVKGAAWTNSPAAGTDLSEAALEDAVIAIGKYNDDVGKRIACMPKKLIVPVDNQFEAERILNTDGRVGTANNDLNAIKSLGKVPGGFCVNHFITDVDSWFLQTDVEDGFIRFERVPVSFSEDNDFDTGNLKYKGRGRYAFTYGDARCVYGSLGS